MEHLKRLDKVKVNASYSRHHGKTGKVAAIIEKVGLAAVYDVWLPADKITVRFNGVELEKL